MTAVSLCHPCLGKKEKIPLSRRSLLLEGDVELRMLSEEGAQVMDFNRYAAVVALTPEKLPAAHRRVRAHAGRTAAQHAEAETTRGAKELELEKAKATHQLMDARAAQLK